MSNKTIEMTTIRQILRLYASGRGTKYISHTTGVARNTVKKYLRRYAELHTTMEELEGLSDVGFFKCFFNEARPVAGASARSAALAPLLPSLAAMLKKRGITKEAVHQRYLEQCPLGYRISAFKQKLNGYTNAGKPSMRMEHKAGDKMFVDFTGKKLYLTDMATGEATAVEVFVAILGCSQLTFVMAVATQQKEDFIMACERALHFYGGVPQAIVPDNLRSAVTRASRYEARLNEHFAAFAEHYHTVGFPTRAYKPKDKALVEGAVKIVYTTVFSKIDEQAYQSLAGLNAAILVCLQAHNNRLLTGEPYSRQQQFDELEKMALQPLNPYPFVMLTTQLSTVNKYGHVMLSTDKRYYSVPYRLIGKRLRIRYDSRTVSVYDEGSALVATHERYAGIGHKYITQPEHLASQHRFLADWNPQKFMEQAAAIGGPVADYIAKILAREQYPEQTYKSCSGVLSFAKRVGSQRLVDACRRADTYGLYNYGIIDQILRSKADQIPLDQETDIGQVPVHDNIRGQGYYE